MEGRPIGDEYLIVHGGGLVGTGAHAYSTDKTPGPSVDAAQLKVETDK